MTDESPPAGTRWTVSFRYGPEATIECPDKPGWWTPDPDAKPLDCGVVDHSTGTEHKRYKTEKKARSVADELNRLDVQGPLDPEFADRRKRLKKLAPNLGSWIYEGPRDARWPVRPEKYAVYVMSHGWHAEGDWELADDKAAIEGLLSDEESTVCQIVDLDTGMDVSFTREIIVSVDIPDQSE